MNGLGKELKHHTAADIPTLWANIAQVRDGGLRSPNLSTRTAAAYAILAVEARIGAIMAEGLPQQGPRPPEEIAVAAGVPAVAGAVEAAMVDIPLPMQDAAPVPAMAAASS